MLPQRVGDAYGKATILHHRFLSQVSSFSLSLALSFLSSTFAYKMFFFYIVRFIIISPMHTPALPQQQSKCKTLKGRYYRTIDLRVTYTVKKLQARRCQSCIIPSRCTMCLGQYICQACVNFTILCNRSQQSYDDFVQVTLEDRFCFCGTLTS